MPGRAASRMAGAGEMLRHPCSGISPPLAAWSPGSHPLPSRDFVSGVMPLTSRERSRRQERAAPDNTARSGLIPACSSPLHAHRVLVTVVPALSCPPAWPGGSGGPEGSGCAWPPAGRAFPGLGSITAGNGSAPRPGPRGSAAPKPRPGPLPGPSGTPRGDLSISHPPPPQASLHRPLLPRGPCPPALSQP